MVTNSPHQSFLAYRARPDGQALLALLSACQAPVYNVCFQVLRNSHDAEDAAQDVLLEILEGASRLPDPVAFERWMYRVATNTALDFRKKRSRRQSHENRRADMKPAESLPGELVEGVHEALGGLDDDLRRLVLQHYFERRTLEEMAAAEGCSTAAVWKRIEKGKERLRQALTATALAGLVLSLDRVLEAAEPAAPPTGLISDALKSRAEAAAQVPLPTRTRLPRILGGVAAVCLLGLIVWRALPETPPASISPRSSAPAVSPEAGTTASAPEKTAPSAPPSPAPAPRSAETGTLLVRVVDLSRGGRLPSFRFAVQVSGGGYFQFLSKSEEFEAPIALPKGLRQATAELRLLDPEIRDGGRQQVALLADQRLTVDLVVRSGEEVAGFVQQKDGAPLVGALVFVGTQELGRGDEPFKPFRPARILDGARTDAAGRFVLRKTGALLTVFHEDYSPVTVPLEESWRVTLPPRGRIRGRLLTSDGSPLPAVRVTLDQDRQATTDDRGGFEFDKVEAGTRGIQLPGRRLVAVSIRPGQDLEVDLGAGLSEVVIALPEELPKGALGAVVGLDALSTTHGFRGPAREARLQGVLPGKYLVLTSTGRIGRADLNAPDARADFGTAGLEIISDVERRIYVLPDCAGELAEIMAKRLATRSVSPGAPLAYPSLPAGDYLVKSVDGTRLGRVQVGAAGARLELRGP